VYVYVYVHVYGHVYAHVYAHVHVHVPVHESVPARVLGPNVQGEGFPVAATARRQSLRRAGQLVQLEMKDMMLALCGVRASCFVLLENADGTSRISLPVKSEGLLTPMDGHIAILPHPLPATRFTSRLHLRMSLESESCGLVHECH
jgi:hypothetical protein